MTPLKTFMITRVYLKGKVYVRQQDKLRFERADIIYDMSKARHR